MPDKEFNARRGFYLFSELSSQAKLASAIVSRASSLLPVSSQQDVVGNVTQQGCLEPVHYLSETDVEADLDTAECALPGWIILRSSNTTSPRSVATAIRWSERSVRSETATSVWIPKTRSLTA